MPLSTAAVAASVRAELARAGISGRQLARDLGWKPAYVQRRLTTVTEPDPWPLADLARIAEHLSVPLTTFITDESTAASA